MYADARGHDDVKLHTCTCTLADTCARVPA